MTLRTSVTHPLRIDPVSLSGGGTLGLSFCPGKKQATSLTGGWDRDVAMDVATIREWGATTVITVLEKEEMAQLGVARLGDEVKQQGMDWIHLTLPNDAIPGHAFLAQWNAVRQAVHARLENGEKLFIHCMGGIGRTSLLAGMMMVEQGTSAKDAVEAVRSARKDSFIVPEQVTYLEEYATRQGNRALPSHHQRSVP